MNFQDAGAYQQVSGFLTEGICSCIFAEFLCFGGKEGSGFFTASNCGCHSYGKVFLIQLKNVSNDNQMTLRNGICFVQHFSIEPWF